MNWSTKLFKRCILVCVPPLNKQRLWQEMANIANIDMCFFCFCFCFCFFFVRIAKLAIGMGKQQTFRDPHTGFPMKWRLRNKHRNSIVIMRHHPDLDSASDWMKQIFNQSKVLTRSGKRRVISMEFLCSFLRRHFTSKLLVVPQNVGYFLRTAIAKFDLPDLKLFHLVNLPLYSFLR